MIRRIFGPLALALLLSAAPAGAQFNEDVGAEIDEGPIEDSEILEVPERRDLGGVGLRQDDLGIADDEVGIGERRDLGVLDDDIEIDDDNVVIRAPRRGDVAADEQVGEAGEAGIDEGELAEIERRTRPARDSECLRTEALDCPLTRPE